MSARSRANWQRLRLTAARIKWSHWGVAVLLISAILWVLLRPDMWGPCLVLTAAAIALAVAGRDTE